MLAIQTADLVTTIKNFDFSCLSTSQFFKLVFLTAFRRVFSS